MKRILKLFVLIGLLAITVPCYADSLVVDVDTSDPLTDVNASYWFGSDANPAVDPIGSEVGNKLVNSDPETEEAWLEALLGYVYDNPGVNYLDRIVAGQGGLGDSVKSINDFNPGFAWTWAVVKLGNNNSG